MGGRMVRIVWVGVLTCAAGGWAAAAAGPTNAELADEVKQLRAEVSQLKAERKGVDTSSAEFRKQIKDLMGEVLDERRGAGGDVTAGWDKHFFIQKPGMFRLEIDGQLQFRYVWTQREHNDDDDGFTPEDFDECFDEVENGFTVRRAKIGVSGYIYDPNLEYRINGGFERSGGAFILENAYLKYKFCEDHYVQAGQYKAPFLREELVSCARQEAVERSAVNELFTIDYAQGVTVGGQYGKESGFGWAWTVLHDGRENDNTDFAEDSTEFATAGRLEFMPVGNWGQWKDFAAWSKDPFGVLIGVGADYAQMDHGSCTDTVLRDYVQYTVDASMECYPVNLFAAGIARNGRYDGSLAGMDDTINQFGVVAQGGVFVVKDKVDVFARYEWVNYDARAEFGHKTGSVSAIPPAFEDNVNFYTVGTNYYIHGHDLKVTADAMYAPEGVRAGESGLGTVTSTNGEPEWVFRLQVQVLF